VIKKLDRLIIPMDYRPILSVRDTEIAIKKIKDFQQRVIPAYLKPIVKFFVSQIRMYFSIKIFSNIQ